MEISGGAVRGCEWLWDEERSQRMQKLVQEAVGHCPCLSGERCPVMPTRLTVRVTAAAPVT